MGRKVVDITKPWKRPSPIEGEEVQSFMSKRKRIRYMGKGTVTPGLPWEKPEFDGIQEPGRRVNRNKKASKR